MLSFRLSIRRSLIYAGLLSIAGLALAACGDTETPAEAPTRVATAAQGPLVQANAKRIRSTELMRRLYSAESLDLQAMADALAEIRQVRDMSLVPVLVELLRFMPTPALREQTGGVLRELTGQDFAAGDTISWAEWLGKRLDELRPPTGYVEWKIALLERISPRYRGFLELADETARIDLREVVWGAVAPDEIADLENPPSVPATDADYLGDDERVFGVSINGEHRAYPLRIANAHEMVNDVLGGEPIALAY